MPEQRFEITVPEDEAGGTYANFLSVWHTPYEFTFDFSVTMPPRVEVGPDGDEVAVVPTLVTSRVKVPPQQVFAILQAINENLGRYEAEVGPLYPPGQQPQA